MEEQVYEKLPERLQWIIESLFSAIDYFCWNITGDTAMDCYFAHANSDLYELVEEFVGAGYSELTEEDLEYISNLPDDIYDLANEYVQNKIQEVADKLFEECINDPECREGCEEVRILA